MNKWGQVELSRLFRTVKSSNTMALFEGHRAQIAEALVASLPIVKQLDVIEDRSPCVVA